MLTDQSFIPKSFQLTNQLNSQTFIYNIQVNYLPSTRQINFSKAISDICALGLNLNNCHIFYLDFKRKLYVHIGFYPFQTHINLNYQLFLDSSIKLRFRKIVSPHNHTASDRPTSNHADHSETKKNDLKKKGKQRTIGQAKYYVTEWRNLHQMVDQKGKRIYTYYTAADEIGLPKKTLDDYYYQLKQGQLYGFPIEQNLNQKIGVLRKFVKTNILNSIQKNGEICSSSIIDDIAHYIESYSDSDEQRLKRQKNR